MTSRALSGQKSWCDFDIDFVSFPSLRVVKSELTPTPAAAALVLVINVLRFVEKRPLNYRAGYSFCWDFGGHGRVGAILGVF
jgi:hypothetical protein